MKKFLFILYYIKPYWFLAALSILTNLTSVLFSLFSVSMLIPFLGILFGTQPLVESVGEFEFTVNSVTEHFNYFISQLIKDHGPHKALMAVSLIMIGSALFRNTFRYLGSHFIVPLRANIIRDIRNKLLTKILSLPLAFFSEERKGDIMSRITSDVQEIEASIVSSLDMVFRDPITIIFYLGVLFYMSPQLTIFVLIFLPLSGYLIGRIGRTLRKTTFRGQKKLGVMLSVLEESLGGLRVIKAFNAEGFIQKRFKDLNTLFTMIAIKTNRRRALASPMSEFLGIIVMTTIMYFGATLVLEGNSGLKSQELIAYLAMFYLILEPSKSFSAAYYNILKGLASADRIDMILNAEESIKNKPNAYSLDNFSNKIEYRNISFRYDKEYVLKNINLTIEKGKTVALVGQSGSGKTTMADLLPRFYDVSEGELLIDDINIKDFKLEDLRGLMGIVNQDPILFNDSFFNNIAFGALNAREEEVIAAAKVANAHEFINTSKLKYQTNIGDRGGKLSGGQRQRVSIARAVLKNPPILILDEATSALDTESERLVQDALIKLMKNRTTLVIAHRLSTVIHADEICVLHEGKIVERGKHDELLALNGYYKKLHDLQMFSAE